MKIARGSRFWILSPFFACIIFFIFFIFLKDEVIGAIFLFVFMVLLIITIVMILFFRDPDRIVGKGIVSCADGRVREISNINDAYVGDCTKVSVFMNLYNVHVNRMPIEGTIKDIVHKKGFHIPAFKKDSDKNERVIIKADTKIGNIKIVQIAGTLARRIFPYTQNGKNLKKGERIGIIRFGSRVDVYLSNKCIKNIKVKKGQIVKAGESTIAEIND